MLQIHEADRLLALSDNDPSHVSYLDRETGDVILVLADLFSPEDPEYVDEEALSADPRYLPVEPTPPARRTPGWSSSSRWQPILSFALAWCVPLNRPRPFRGFKDELLNAPTERQEWFDFEEARQREAAIEWLQLTASRRSSR